MGASPSNRKPVKFTISPQHTPQHTPPQTTKLDAPVISETQKDDDPSHVSDSTTGAIDITMPTIPEISTPVIIEDGDDKGDDEVFRHRDESDGKLQS